MLVLLKQVVLASLENEFTGYIGLAAIHLPQFTTQACLMAEFIMVGLKGVCTHIPSSWIFLSDDEIEDLKADFQKYICISESLSC